MLGHLKLPLLRHIYEKTAENVSDGHHISYEPGIKEVGKQIEIVYDTDQQGAVLSDQYWRGIKEQRQMHHRGGGEGLHLGASVLLDVPRYCSGENIYLQKYHRWHSKGAHFSKCCTSGSLPTEMPFPLNCDNEIGSMLRYVERNGSYLISDSRTVLRSDWGSETLLVSLSSIGMTIDSRGPGVQEVKGENWVWKRIRYLVGGDRGWLIGQKILSGHSSWSRWCSAQ